PFSLLGTPPKQRVDRPPAVDQVPLVIAQARKDKQVRHRGGRGHRGKGRPGGLIAPAPAEECRETTPGPPGGADPRCHPIRSSSKWRGSGCCRRPSKLRPPSSC